MCTAAFTIPWQRVGGICVVAATLALTPVIGGAALASSGGRHGADHRWHSHRSNNHCITPAGTDANEILGVTEQILLLDAPPEAGCGPVSPGESWIPLGGAQMWITNTSFEVVPPGYQPSAATPMKDFLSKATTVTYVIDPGTRRERTFRYRVKDVVKVDTVDEFFPPGIWERPYPIAQFLAKLPPLPPGKHTYSSTLQMSAQSCDGIGADRSSNCIGPGTIPMCTGIPFTVEKRTARRPK